MKDISGRKIRQPRKEAKPVSARSSIVFAIDQHDRLFVKLSDSAIPPWIVLVDALPAVRAFSAAKEKHAKGAVNMEGQGR